MGSTSEEKEKRHNTPLSDVLLPPPSSPQQRRQPPLQDNRPCLSPPPDSPGPSKSARGRQSGTHLARQVGRERLSSGPPGAALFRAAAGGTLRAEGRPPREGGWKIRPACAGMTVCPGGRGRRRVGRRGAVGEVRRAGRKSLKMARTVAGSKIRAISRNRPPQAGTGQHVDGERTPHRLGPGPATAELAGRRWRLQRRGLVPAAPRRPPRHRWTPRSRTLPRPRATARSGRADHDRRRG